MNRYLRDLRGHGSVPPQANWPGDAKIAVQIVLNYEEGGENNILHGDPGSEAFLSEIVGAESWPAQRHWNMESIYEYGARAGFWRLHRLLADLPVTVYGVATALARSPEQVAAMQDADWEIASHGLKWIEYRDFDPDEERQHLLEAIRLHTEVTGRRPTGWYTGRCSENTLQLVAEEGGFDYIADSYADDLPYWVRVDARDQLVIPYTLDCNDMRFATPQGFNSGDQFENYLKDTFDTLYSEGEDGSPKMMSIGLHCRLAGRPGRIAALRRFLDHARARDGVWFARRQDIADHWRQEHPPVKRVLPSKMEKHVFVNTYGSIFEHSPWVAEAAWELELGAAHDCAAGLHNALCRTFRTADSTKRLEVIDAHPDLAGKLAQAQRLTAESTAEQASAGLDALTDDERATFMELNEEYTAKHGFPFIIAVRDYTKPEIVEAFRTRLRNDSQTEFTEACHQVERIAYHRLKDLLP